MSPKILEIIHMKKSKAPVMLEMPVPEKSFPYLVGNPKKEGESLTWVEAPNARGTILSWGQDCSVEELIADMTSLVKKRGSEEGWGVVQICTNTAGQRMQSLGISETHRVGDLVVPSDPTLLGCIIIIGSKKYPLIHNPSRGITIISQEEKQNG
jgi:hypothetical protein